MAVAHVGSTGTTTTATAYGTTSTTVAYTSVAAGRIAIIVAATKLSTATWGAVTGFTQIVNGTGGTGSSSSTTGTTRIGVWYRILDGSETGNVTVSASGAVATTAAMSVYSKTRTNWAVPFGVTASDTSDGTNPTGTAAAWAKTIIPGDMLIAGYAGEQGTTTAPTANTLTQTSATFGTRTHRNYRNNSSGTTNTLTSWDGTVTTANNTNALTNALTWSISTAGAFAAVILRDYNATLSNTFEGGTDTTTISTGNSGGASGTAFDFVNIPSTSTLTYTAANAARGTLGAAISSGGTPGITYVQYSSSINGGSDIPIYARIRYKVSSLPASQFRLAVISGGDGSFQGDYRLNTDGTIGLYSGTGTLISNTTATITAGQWFDLGVSISVFSATVGVTELKLFLNPSSDTATETETGSSQNTLRNGGLNALQVGMVTSTVANQTVYVDDIQYSTSGYPSALAMVVSGSAALSVQSNMTGAGFGTTTGVAALSAQSNMAATGFGTATGIVALSGQSSMNTVSVVSTTGSVAFSVQSNLTASGARAVNGIAAFSIQSNMTAVGSNTVVSGSVLSAQSNLVTSALNTVLASVTLSAQCNLATSGIATSFGLYSGSIQSNLSALAKAAAFGVSSLTVQSTMNSAGFVTTQGIVALTVQSNMTAAGTIGSTPPAALLTAQFNMAVIGSVTVKGSALLSGQSNMDATGKATVKGVAALSSQSGLNATGTGVVLGTVAMTVQSGLIAAGSVPLVLTGAASLSAQLVMNVNGNAGPGWTHTYIEVSARVRSGDWKSTESPRGREGSPTVKRRESKSMVSNREGG